MADTVSKRERSRIMAAVKSTDTAPEMVVRQLVLAMGARYRLHSRVLPGRPDLVFPRHRKVIFVHGCFWHMHTCGRCRMPKTRRAYWLRKLQRNRKRDQRVVRELKRGRWGVLVVWECELNSPGRLLARIRRFLGLEGKRSAPPPSRGQSSRMEPT